MIRILTLAIVFTLCTPMYAYIGPGMSGGLIATILGIIGSIFLAIFGVLYYPLKKFFKNRKKK